MSNYARIFVLGLLLSACNFEKSGCDGFNYDNYFSTPGDSLGYVGLTNNSLLYMDTSAQFTFKNSNGFELNFRRQSFLKTNLHQTISTKQVTTKKECGSDINTFTDYAITEQEISSYSGDQLPVQIKYLRRNQVSKFERDSTHIFNINSEEFISIIIGSSSGDHVFNLPYGGNSGKFKNIDSILINGITYQNVLLTYQDSSKMEPGKIIPIGIYYSPINKIIGYYYSNGEVWGIK